MRHLVLVRSIPILVALTFGAANDALAAELGHKAPPPGCILLPDVEDSPNPQAYGAWDTVIPASDGAAIGRILGMQTVHSVLLPSGKLLLASGSSWRNLAPIEYYPLFPEPTAPTGLFVRDDDPFRDDKIETYYQLVNHAAIYDPEGNTFYRIPHPVPQPDPDVPNHFQPTDLFCTGHQHLPDGNVLFAGGTQYYSPFRTGNKSSFIFDWRKEMKISWAKVDWRQLPTEEEDPWIFSGFMKRGRWYPSLTPLHDGRMVLWSGFVGFDRGYPDMYQFEINHYVEFFDPKAFDPKSPEKAWKAIDVKKLPASPFTVEINPNFRPTPGSVCPERCIEDNKFDAFKLYPENYLMSDGRIFLTREGDWVSLRTCDTAFMRRTKHTYWASIGGTNEQPEIKFERGPDRPDIVTSYGTSFLDPNSGNISILGGQPISAGTLLPLAAVNPTHFAGGLGSRKIETFHPAASDPLGGSWTLDPNFLGENPQDDRTMHYAIILPTRQVLIINGGNYDFYGPVFYPILMTPQWDERRQFTGYKKERMSNAVEPRLYHNAALLLPDGRIWISGGNSARATVRTAAVPPADPDRTGQPKPDLDLVDIDMYFFNDGPMAKGQKGMLTTPTENWSAEIFSPPYLFLDPGRRAEIRNLSLAGGTPYDYKSEIGGKTFYLVKSGREYELDIAELPKDCGGKKPALSLMKLSSATHGWENGQRFVEPTIMGEADSGRRLRFRVPNAKEANAPPAFYMLFYVDCLGKPSVAKMVRWDDSAERP